MMMCFGAAVQFLYFRVVNQSSHILTPRVRFCYEIVKSRVREAYFARLRVDRYSDFSSTFGKYLMSDDESRSSNKKQNVEDYMPHLHLLHCSNM